ncbi:MAG TPA: hypothetical protein PLU63_01175 [Candidatus Woesebacteria bacterium]|nr:hypothetical protein [Candidatus Woesebacteria bacterium]
MYKNDYLPEVGKKLLEYGVVSSIVVGGSYSYLSETVLDIKDFRDLDLIIIVKNIEQVKLLLDDNQFILKNCLKIIEPEYVFTKKETKIIEHSSIDGIRFSGINIFGQKISAKIFPVNFFKRILNNSDVSSVKILSRKDKRFFKKKSFDGKNFYLGVINIPVNGSLCVLEDADVFKINNGFSLGVISDLLISGKIVSDNSKINIRTIIKRIINKVYGIYIKNGNKKQNWPKIFIRYERFPNNFNEHLISQLPINIPEKCIDKPDDLLIPFQIHIKDEYLFHTPDLSMNLSKMLIKNETDYKFIETPNLMPFSANSEHGKAIRKDKKTFFYKKMLNENRYQTEIDGYSRLSRYYRKIQKPILLKNNSTTVLYKWSDYGLLSERWIKKLESSDLEKIMEIEMRKNGEILNAYLCSLGKFSVSDSNIQNLYLDRLNNRVTQFYQGQKVSTPNGEIITTERLFELKPIINGVKYLSINEIINKSIGVLSNKKLLDSVLVCGLGDSHGGNVMINSDLSDYLFIDYEFSGIHSPFLDIVKPLYNDCFYDVLYSPLIKQKVNIDVLIKENNLIINHNFEINDFRKMLMVAKMDGIILPFIKTVRLNLDFNTNSPYQEILNSGLFCAAFLTKNITEYPNNYFWLNLSYSVIMSNFCQNYLNLKNNETKNR